MKNYLVVLVTCFIVNSVSPMPLRADELNLPLPGAMVHLSPAFSPALLKGLVIHPEDPFKFDFIIHRGDKLLTEAQKKEEYVKLTKYFLASLAIPDEDQWVNLSPYEKNRIIPDAFGQTIMGRDLLTQDYLLKQIAATLIYPEEGLGKKFWDKVYSEANKRLGTTQIPVNTFNKVWIVADKAELYEKGNAVFLVNSHLKVMLEEDYVASKRNMVAPADLHQKRANQTAGVSEVMREIVLPELQREVNEGQHFAQLRQAYSGMILAAWYKRALRQSLLAEIYANKSKVKGLEYSVSNDVSPDKIYQQYLQAYRKGVFNYIKDPDTTDVVSGATRQEKLPRKYFSGGVVGLNNFVQIASMLPTSEGDPAMVKILKGSTDLASVALHPRETNRTIVDDAAMAIDPELGGSSSAIKIDPERAAEAQRAFEGILRDIIHSKQNGRRRLVRHVLSLENALLSLEHLTDNQWRDIRIDFMQKIREQWPDMLTPDVEIVFNLYLNRGLNRYKFNDAVFLIQSLHTVGLTHRFNSMRPQMLSGLGMSLTSLLEGRYYFNYAFFMDAMEATGFAGKSLEVNAGADNQDDNEVKSFVRHYQMDPLQLYQLNFWVTLEGELRDDRHKYFTREGIDVNALKKAMTENIRRMIIMDMWGLEYLDPHLQAAGIRIEKIIGRGPGGLTTIASKTDTEPDLEAIEKTGLRFRLDPKFEAIAQAANGRFILKILPFIDQREVQKRKALMVSVYKSKGEAGSFLPTLEPVVVTISGVFNTPVYELLTISQYVQGQTLLARIVQTPYSDIEHLRLASAYVQWNEEQHKMGFFNWDVNLLNFVVDASGKINLIDFKSLALDEPHEAQEKQVVITSLIQILTGHLFFRGVPNWMLIQARMHDDYNRDERIDVLMKRLEAIYQDNRIDLRQFFRIWSSEFEPQIKQIMNAAMAAVAKGKQKFAIETDKAKIKQITINWFNQFGQSPTNPYTLDGLLNELNKGRKRNFELFYVGNKDSPTAILLAFQDKDIGSTWFFCHVVAGVQGTQGIELARAFVNKHRRDYISAYVLYQGKTKEGRNRHEAWKRAAMKMGFELADPITNRFIRFPDAAMNTKDLGGIDMNSANLAMSVKEDESIRFSPSSQGILLSNIVGFEPEILAIVPAFLFLPILR